MDNTDDPWWPRPFNAMASYGGPTIKSLNVLTPTGLGEPYIPPLNAMAVWGNLPAPAPLGLGLSLGAFSPPPPSYPKQPKFDCWRREAAWIRTAGDVDAPEAYDHNGNVLYRNASQGEFGCWHAAHMQDDALGGLDVPWNFRAQRSSDNMSEGGILGALLKKLPDNT
jgi:hypothetical protein